MMDTTSPENEIPARGSGNRWKPLLLRLRNKYWIAGTFFGIWMLFFDPKDLGSAIGRWRKYNDLKTSEQHLQNQINDTKKELSQLKTNARTIEKYAREKYLMKKDNEDLFIIPTPAGQNN